MPQEPRVPGVLCFGSFRLDLADGVLQKHGVPLRLGRQPTRILAVLARQPGELVTREQLRQDLWGSDTFVDFEHGLNAAINKLRQTLGDSAERPRFIETLPGRGYRFVAAVRTEIPTAPATDQPPEPPLAAAGTTVSQGSVLPGSSTPRKFPVPLFAMAAIGLLAPALLLFVSRRSPPAPLRPIQFIISAPEGFAFQPAASRQSIAISPDGTRLVLVMLGNDGQFRLWIRDLASIEPREVVGARGAHTLFWSPTGDFLYFGLNRSLRRVSPEPGASPQIIADLSRRVPPIGTWLDPNRLLLSYRQLTVIVPPAGGRASPVAQSYLWPQMLPDKQHLLYLTYDPQIHRFRLRAGRFGEPQFSQQILETDSRVTWVESNRQPGSGYLLYVRSGTLLAHAFDSKRLAVVGEPFPLANNIHVFAPTGAADFSVSNTGVLAYMPLVNRSRITWLDRKGLEISQVSPNNLSVVNVRASLDGRNIAGSVYNVEKGGNEIWVYDTQSKVSRVFAPAPGILDQPIWSPDATRLIYSRGLGRGPQLYMRDIAEKDPEQSLPEGEFQLASDWSRDGRLVLFQSENTTDGDFGVIDLNNRQVSWLLKTSANETSPVFSPDQKWIAFITNESGHPEAYVQAFEGGEHPRLIKDRTRISVSGAQVIRWRGDGREICFLGLDGLLYSVSVKLGAELRFADPVPLFRVPVASLAALPSLFGFDVSKDGSRFLLPVVPEHIGSSLVVIQNWERLLERSEH